MIDTAENRLASRNIALLEYYKGELKFLLPPLTTKCSMVEFAMDVTVLNTNNKAHLKNKGCHSSCPCSLISPFFFFLYDLGVREFQRTPEIKIHLLSTGLYLVLNL